MYQGNKLIKIEKVSLKCSSWFDYSGPSYDEDPSYYWADEVRRNKDAKSNPSDAS